jgi:hypothetical protein
VAEQTIDIDKSSSPYFWFSDFVFVGSGGCLMTYQVSSSSTSVTPTNFNFVVNRDGSMNTVEITGVDDVVDEYTFYLVATSS